MPKHNFKEDLKYEKSNFQRQNIFYHKMIPGLRGIKRTTDHTLQSADIDLFLSLDGNKVVSVSEKKRKTFYEDILFEVMHVTKADQSVRLGWLHKCRADIICYFFDECMFLIKAGTKFKRIFEEKIYPSTLKKFYDFIDEKISKKEETIEIDGETFDITFTAAENQGRKKGEDYITYSIAIKPKDLEKLGIKLKEFNFY